MSQPESPVSTLRTIFFIGSRNQRTTSFILSDWEPFTSMDAELIADYVSETEERLDRISKELLCLEESGIFDSVLVKRELHTLKGLSASLGFREVAELCHSIENHFQVVDGHEHLLAFDAIFAACDFIAAHIDALQRGKELPCLPPSIVDAFHSSSCSASHANYTSSPRSNIEASTQKATRSCSKASTEASHECRLKLPAVCKNSSARRYLVVDDDTDMQRLICKVLDEYGNCTVASDGREALVAFESALCTERHFDGVYLDLNMPNMDGHCALERIRCLEHEHGHFGPAGTKVVIVTSAEDDRHSVRAYKAGCQLFLKKPLNASDLRRSFAALGILGREGTIKRRSMTFLDDVRTVGLRDNLGSYQLAEVQWESFAEISTFVDDVSRMRPDQPISVDYRGRPTAAVVREIEPMRQDGRFCVNLEWVQSAVATQST